MKQYEKQVFKDFKTFANVVEAWALYDSIVLCSDFYGTESNVGGWFTTYQAFAAQETHSFFKTRTEGTAGLQYTNQQSADSMDFAFICHSIGIAVLVPPNNFAAYGTENAQANPDFSITRFMGADLPRHMGIQLKVQQDIRSELTTLQCPPGYGPLGGGQAFSGVTNDATPVMGDIPFMSASVAQGVPILKNRYPLPSPIGIPRTATIEGILHVSEFARNVLTDVDGPYDIIFNSDDGAAPYANFPQRYVIQFSLIGERLVQQRAQYHR